MQVTIKDLISLRACTEDVERFRSLFGDSAEVTYENVMRAFDGGIDVQWWAGKVFGMAYWEAIAPHWRAYDEAIAPHTRAYDEAIAADRRVYWEAIAPHWRAYDEACAAHLRAYQEACAKTIVEFANAPKQVSP